MYLKKWLQNECFTGKFPEIFIKTIYLFIYLSIYLFIYLSNNGNRIVIDGCSKNLSCLRGWNKIAFFMDWFNYNLTMLIK